MNQLAELRTFKYTAYPGSAPYKTPNRVASVDADVDEMIDAGIHICIASGNSYYYIDNANGQDYNNYVTFFGSNRYYHRGSSPFDEEAFIVGNMDLDYTGNLENKAPLFDYDIG